jgi:multidrug resistance efflux pump
VEDVRRFFGAKKPEAPYCLAWITEKISECIRRLTSRKSEPFSIGQLLFVIDRRPYQAALRQAKATLALKQATLNNAQMTVNRYVPLEKQHAVTKEQLDTALAAVKEDQQMRSRLRRM